MKMRRVTKRSLRGCWRRILMIVRLTLRVKISKIKAKFRKIYKDSKHTANSLRRPIWTKVNTLDLTPKLSGSCIKPTAWKTLIYKLLIIRIVRKMFVLFQDTLILRRMRSLSIIRIRYIENSRMRTRVPVLSLTTKTWLRMIKVLLITRKRMWAIIFIFRVKVISQAMARSLINLNTVICCQPIISIVDLAAMIPNESPRCHPKLIRKTRIDSRFLSRVKITWANWKQVKPLWMQRPILSKKS